MIGKPIIGRSFGGCVRYLVNRPEATVLEAEGVRMQSANTITRDFNLQRKLNPELGKAVGHTILSWSKEDADKLDDRIMVEVAKAYMKQMGISDTQYLMVKHTDRQHPHLHIVYNRVDNHGKTITDNNNYKRNVVACRSLTESYNFYIALDKGQVNRQRLKGKDQVRYAIYDAVKKALKSTGNWHQLEDKLKQKGIGILFKHRSGTTEVQGISFKKDGLIFKGSAIDRAFSFAKLDAGLKGNLKQQPKNMPLENQHYREKYSPGDHENRSAPDPETLLDVLFKEEHLQTGYDPYEQPYKRKKKKKSIKT